MIITDSKNTLAYKLLMSNAYRPVRYLIFILIAGVVAYHQVFMTYQSEDGVTGILFIPAFCIVGFYLISGYLNLYYLIPVFFLRRRFITYIIWFSLIVAGVSGILIGIEYFFIYQVGIPGRDTSYFVNNRALWLGFLCDFLILGISLAGLSVTVILKNWIVENQRLTQLQQRKIEMAVEQVKEQLSPHFLYRILHHTGEEAGRVPQKASAMILHLSRLLRYQLYEGNQSNVLLSGEIQFLTTYLILEQYNKTDFEFHISTKGEVSHVLVPPLLFLPLVQQAVKKWEEAGKSSSLDFIFCAKEGVLTFKCSQLDWTCFDEKQKSILFARFSYLFPNDFTVENQLLTINL